MLCPHIYTLWSRKCPLRCVANAYTLCKGIMIGQKIKKDYRNNSLNLRGNGCQTAQTGRTLLQTQLHGFGEAYIGHTLLLAECVHAADLREEGTIHRLDIHHINPHPTRITIHYSPICAGSRPPARPPTQLVQCR